MTGAQQPVKHAGSAGTKGTLKPVRWVALALYWLLVIGLLAYIWVAGHAHHAATHWILYWCAVSAGFVLVPWLPITGPCCFVLLGYGMSSGAPELDTMIGIRLLDGAALLVIAGSLLAPAGSVRVRVTQDGAAMGAVLLFSWVGGCVATAVVHGASLGSFPRHDPSGWWQAGVLLVATARAVNNQRDFAILAGVIVSTVLGRVAVQGISGIHLESYVATLLVIGAPLAMLGRCASANPVLRATFGAMALGSMCMLALTLNRAAALAALAMLVAYLWQVRRTRIAKGLALALVLAVMAAMLLHAPYLDRFRVLVSDSAQHATASLDRETVAERLQLWSAGWSMALDHPVVGVGPGNYPGLLGVYIPGKEPLAAHSNYVQMLAETGFPGLMIYLGFFAVLLWKLESVRRHAAPLWLRDAAQMLQLSLFAYLVGGIFNSRHDFVLVYLIAGWVVALGSLAGRVPGRDGIQARTTGEATV